VLEGQSAIIRSHALRGGSSNRAFHPMNGRIACGSMVLLLFFFQKNHVVNFFEKGMGFFHPAGS
jgi:hypothetical protein